MRIIIDLQAAQAENRFRGIGRLSLALALDIARYRGSNEVIVALNAVFSDTIREIRDEFRDVLPPQNIRVWQGLANTQATEPKNQERIQAAALIREAFLAQLNPSIVVVMSLFEGYVDNAVTTIGVLPKKIPTAVFLHDLIPLIYPGNYLKDTRFCNWYMDRLEDLKKSDLILCNSNCTRKEALDHAGFHEGSVVTVFAGKSEFFEPKELSSIEKSSLFTRYGLNRPFVMYGGGIDFRKNIEGLIRAFALLPKATRDRYQLVVVCSVQEDDRKRLEAFALQKGLSDGQYVMTGFVSEGDLIALYNSAHTFVFPSLHEGFGLPALEAMACGAPVIGSNRSSLPEVIGHHAALFDPENDTSIADKLFKVLTDENFREMLRKHGLDQSKQFSWEISAKKSIAALETWFSGAASTTRLDNTLPRKRLAFIAPLPPEKTGIANYSSELLPELSRYYDIEVIVDQVTVSDPWITRHCSIRDVSWFESHVGTYDRILFQVGNSAFHQHMFDLIRDYSGVVVLHDFYLSGIMAHRDFQGLAPGAWPKALYQSHGYPALKAFDFKEGAGLIWEYPASLSVIQEALGLIVHSAHSMDLGQRWYGGDFGQWTVIPHLRTPPKEYDRRESRQRLGWSDREIVVCAFGLLGPSKLNDRLIKSWLASSVSKNPRCHLIFVGQNHEGEYGKHLLKQIATGDAINPIRITGWASQKDYCQHLAAADIAVQLRSLSRGETSGSALDVMNYGLALIVNANGSMADLDPKAVMKLPDKFSDQELIDALERLVEDEGLRHQMGREGFKVIQTDHDPSACAKAYFEAIEEFYEQQSSSAEAIIQTWVESSQTGRLKDHLAVAEALGRNFPPRVRQRQVMVDISEWVQRDVRTGIQRVVRSVLTEWLSKPLEGVRIEPVYATETEGYRYARQFTMRFIGGPSGVFEDEPVEWATGDVFLGLDLQPQVVRAQKDFFTTLQNGGVKVAFVLYDLLCVRLPHTFPPGASGAFSKWLVMVAECDQVIAISRAVADDFNNWIKEQGLEKRRPVKIDWFHLGADIENSAPTQGVPQEAHEVLSIIKRGISFIMVGTLEPRKAHLQTLEAFERLWNDRIDCTLVIVGKQGWMVEELVHRLEEHPEKGRRLFWLKGVSDEYLDALMNASSCLIAPSLGEGFGLPLIEASKHGLPILARDIPVFQEVMGASASYFQGESPESLRDAIFSWIKRYKIKNRNLSDYDINQSNTIPIKTWRSSAEDLMNICLYD